MASDAAIASVTTPIVVRVTRNRNILLLYSRRKNSIHKTGRTFMSISHTFLSGIVAAVIVLATGLILLSLPVRLWDDWQPASCLATGCFCEAVNNFSAVRQQANTWSSLAYVIV